MNQLSNNDISALAVRLTELKEQAQREIDAVTQEIAADHQAQDHAVVTRSGEAEEYRVDEVRRAEISIDQDLVQQIDAAQARMEAGRYGLCCDCGDVIARERLFAYPAAIRCTECQSEIETRS